MTLRTLILNSLRFRWRTHLGVVLGAAVGSAALVGALVVGDSVRGTLRDRALERLGHVRFALSLMDRSVTADLARRLPGGHQESGQSQSAQVYSPTRPASALMLPALASTQDGSSRANQIQLIGVGSEGGTNAAQSVSFWDFALQRAPTSIRPGEVWLNEALATQLKAHPGDTLVFRVRKPSVLSRDATITPHADASVALRPRVAGVRTGAGLGDFSLRASQIPPFNAFVNLGELQRATGMDGRVNLLVSSGVRVAAQTNSQVESASQRSSSAEELPPAQAAADLDHELDKAVRLADYEARLQPAPDGTIELSTRRIFLDPALVRAALAAVGPSVATPSSGTNAECILTYLANLLRHGDRTTPYSMVTAAGSPWTPPAMRDDEMLVNQWLADDQRLKAGDSVDMSYFVVDSGSHLTERTNRFRVRAIVPLSGIYADRTLMPEFPGIAKAESTHEWDAGFPLVYTIRDKDEEYWKQHRGTPKAFVTLAAGQRMWANRFGNLTAIRFPVPTNVARETFQAALEKNILTHLHPEELGLRFQPVREQALAAANQSQDFGGLFIGFSFFLIVAALILMALLFQFGVEQRLVEVGTLLAVGFTPRQVRRLLLGEGVLLGLIGGVMGAFGGLVYARLMLRGLTTIWRSAIGTSALTFRATPETVCIGWVSAVAVSAFTIWLVLRKQAKQPARALLAGEIHSAPRKARSRGAFVALVAGLGALATVGWALAAGETANAEAFFSAGSLCLIAGLALVSAILVWLIPKTVNPARKQPAEPGSLVPPTDFTLAGLALRGATRRRSRSLAVVGLLACGSFIIASIGAFRLDANRDAWQRSSGTGGFALMGQTTLPVLKDLNTPAGLDFFGLGEKDFADVSFVSFRVREGDETSCLNLNHPQQPRLLGVKPEQLAERGAFSFAQLENAGAVTNGWMLLKHPIADAKDNGTADEVPAIGDAAAIQWALGKKVGDTVDYTDEQGRTFKLRLVGALANSVLQGQLIIDEDAFLTRFPNESGYRMFLIDAPSNRVAQVSAALSRGLEDVGLELTPTARRLAQFNAVQNTYLGTFQVLGGLGLLLGAAGLGVVVLRNVLERRAELALLLAVGFRRRSLLRLVLGEHAALLGLGLLVGIGSAAVAVLPALWTPAAQLPMASLAWTLIGVCLVGLLSTWLATWFALRGQLLEALREE